MRDLVEEETPGRSKMTFSDLFPFRWPTLVPWLDVVIADLRLLAETLEAELPPEGLPLDSTLSSTHSWTSEMAMLERWLVLGRLLKPLGFLNS